MYNVGMTISAPCAHANNQSERPSATWALFGDGACLIWREASAQESKRSVEKSALKQRADGQRRESRDCVSGHAKIERIASKGCVSQRDAFRRAKAVLIHNADTITLHGIRGTWSETVVFNV